MCYCLQYFRNLDKKWNSKAKKSKNFTANDDSDMG